MKILKHSNIHKINREIMTLNCINFKSKNLAQLIDYGFDSSLKHHVLVRRNLNFFINYLNLIFIKLKIFEKFGHMSIRDYIIEDHFYSIKQIKQIIRQLLHAIDIVHQNGLIHRDIKPGNIIIDKTNSNVRLIDFGLTEFYFPEKENNLRIATRPFKPVEILVNYKKYFQSFDIWGIGNILGCLVN